MDIKDINPREVLGIEFRVENFHIFFGGLLANENMLKIRFHDYSFNFLKQVHGNRIVQADTKQTQTERIEADGHWSQGLGDALVIQTADCLPVMLAHGEICFALHAGWRGLVSEIIPRALDSMEQLGGRPHEAFAFIGPHIRWHSFVVGQDVADELQRSNSKFNPSDNILHPHPDPEKAYIDLTSLAVNQLKGRGVRKVEVCEGDTFLDRNFLHSYRRDGKAAGRQLSFVVRTS